MGERSEVNESQRAVRENIVERERESTILVTRIIKASTSLHGRLLKIEKGRQKLIWWPFL